jgi:hypothetical protein
MASEFDESDFVDGDFQAAKKSPFALPQSGGAGRPPTREELDSRVTETQQRLMELKRAQEELERERATLEEARRRRTELQTGREEMLQSLTRGVGLLEEAEFNSRRDAEQMARTLGELRDALTKVQSIREETWTQENYNVEVTRALTVIDNGRMEWNAARLKWPLLTGPHTPEQEPASAEKAAPPLLDSLGFLQLCRVGLALTWPLAIVASAALGVFIFLLVGRK